MNARIGLVVGWVLAVLANQAKPVAAAEYFLSPEGRDANAGTSETAPLQTWDAVNRKLTPGDTLTLLDGTYPVGSITKSGTAKDWITVRAKNSRKALLSLEFSAKQNPSNLGVVEWNGLMLANVSYVKVIGLSVQGWNPKHTAVASGHGICIQGSHHILIRDCLARDCSGSGISGSPEWWQGNSKTNGPLDFITIEDCQVSGCAFWNRFICSGISLWKSHASGLGPDPAGFNCVVRRNMVYANENKIGPGGGPVATATDGNGIIIDCNNDNDYPYATLVEGNLVYDNGGRGIHVLKSDNVTVRYNTCWHNNRCKLDGTWKQGELESDGSTKYHAADNIAVASTNPWSAAISLHALGPAAPAVELQHNLFFGAREVDAKLKVTESGTLTSDPQFAKPSPDPAVADFHLQSGSPALRAADASPAPATDLGGVARVQGPGNDLGAYASPRK